MNFAEALYVVLLAPLAICMFVWAIREAVSNHLHDLHPAPTAPPPPPPPPPPPFSLRRFAPELDALTVENGRLRDAAAAQERRIQELRAGLSDKSPYRGAPPLPPIVVEAPPHPTHACRWCRLLKVSDSCPKG